MEQLLSCEFLNSVMEAAGFAVWEMELPGGTVTFSENKTKMLGYDSEQFQHYSDFTELIHPDDIDRVMQAMNDHLNHNCENYSVEYRIRCSDNSYLWLKDIGRIVRSDNTSTILQGLIVNINKEKLVHEKYINQLMEAKKLSEENERKYKALIEYSPFAIGASINDVPAYANKAMLDLYGFDAMDDFLKTPKRQFILKEDKEYILNFIDLINKGVRKLPATLEYRMINKKNEFKYLRSVIFDLNFENYHYRQSIIFDVTKEKEQINTAMGQSVDGLFLMQKKNEINSLKQLFTELVSKYKISNKDSTRIEEILQGVESDEKQWNEIKKQFEVIHVNFFKALLNLHPSLNQNDLKHCALIKMQKTNNEISRLLNIQSASLQRYRQRLKKKMNLKSATDLIKYIKSL